MAAPTLIAPAILIAPGPKHWLATSQQARILHLFDRVCNLVNESQQVLSLVQADVGAGPFSLLLTEQRPFTSLWTPQTPVTCHPHALLIGSDLIDITHATVWLPTPNWTTIQQQTAVWRPRLTQMAQWVAQTAVAPEPAPIQQRLDGTLAALCQAIHQDDWAQGQTAVAQLAGLGRGLTPTGDDLLLGILVALWATSATTQREKWATVICETAVPRTTTLSAAWLHAAAQGEVTQAWHTLFNAWLRNEDGHTAVQHILQTGYSSGQDALRGFLTLLHPH